MEARADKEAINNKTEAGGRHEALGWSSGGIRLWVQYKAEGCEEDGQEEEKKKRKEDKAYQRDLSSSFLCHGLPPEAEGQRTCRRSLQSSKGLVIIGRLHTQERDQQVRAHLTPVRGWWGYRSWEWRSRQGQDSFGEDLPEAVRLYRAVPHRGLSRQLFGRAFCLQWEMGWKWQAVNQGQPGSRWGLKAALTIGSVKH